MDSDPSFNQCGFYCYVSIDQCDFFAMELDYCHLGRYSYNGKKQLQVGEGAVMKMKD